MMRRTLRLVALLSVTACGSSPAPGSAAAQGGVGNIAAGGASAGAGFIAFGGASAVSTGGNTAGGTCVGTSCIVGCGNGKVEPTLGEVCDDGNNRSGDGCSSDCKTVETNYACPKPGAACVSLVQCGDGRVAGQETCDDGNTKAKDGCDASCQVETGWQCPAPGAPCVPRCGDGLLTGAEQCDGPIVGHGCSETCSFEPGYVCDAPLPGVTGPAVCHETRCGDRVREGNEACDDGNAVDGDGCSAACTLEPECAKGSCSSKCGDRLKAGAEDCDDGNTQDGDGCSSACQIEDGFSCSDSSGAPPSALNLLSVYRDFISFPISPATRHPDFEADFQGDDVTPLLVKPTLDADDKPVMDGRCSDVDAASNADTTLCPYGQMLTSQANFDQWYRDAANVNLPIRTTLALARGANGAYLFDSAPSGFYPIDDLGFTQPPAKEATADADASVNDGQAHDFGFTTEIHYFFQYRGGESLDFSGDDDVWIFVNRKLALDIGGLHPRTAAVMSLDDQAAELAITRGHLYEIALFHAERHSAGSNFKLTLTGFVPTSSVCLPKCGDGVVVANEQCDLGTAANTGAYGGCTVDCKRGPYCGDGMLDETHEACDDGTNLTTYGLRGSPGCAPGCVLSGYCGDGKLDGAFGEQCDLGTQKNTGAYGTCTSDCQLPPRCGDGILQSDAGEACDDGNTVSGDGCSFNCRSELR